MRDAGCETPDRGIAFAVHHRLHGLGSILLQPAYGSLGTLALGDIDQFGDDDLVVADLACDAVIEYVQLLSVSPLHHDLLRGNGPLGEQSVGHDLAGRRVGKDADFNAGPAEAGILGPAEHSREGGVDLEQDAIVEP